MMNQIGFQVDKSLSCYKKAKFIDFSLRFWVCSLYKTGPFFQVDCQQPNNISEVGNFDILIC